MCDVYLLSPFLNKRSVRRALSHIKTRTVYFVIVTLSLVFFVASPSFLFLLCLPV